jgi:DNA-binding HxlR family transcriptional regulator
MKRTSFAADSCPVARAVDVVGDWWSLLIVRDAFFGRRRFGEFQAGLGVAKNILTDRLKKLVAAGVLEQVPAADGSAYSEYALTERGRRLLPVLVALGQWGACADAGFTVVDRKKGKPARLEFRSADGRPLDPEDVRLVPPSATRPGKPPAAGS